MKLNNPPSHDDVGIDRWRFSGCSPKGLMCYFWRYGTAAKGEPRIVEGFYEFNDKYSFDKYVSSIIA